MKIILSPAKSLNEDVDFSKAKTSSIYFPDETNYLARKMGKLSRKKIAELMHINSDLADLNYQRYQNWSDSFTPKNSFPAAYGFNGAAYQGLDFASLSAPEQKLGSDRLRILSGLYGLLKPLALIHPYRLEMGLRFKVTPKITNLYKYWADKIRHSLEKELTDEGNSLLVNLASSEYFKAAQLSKMKDIEVITPVFKDMSKKGEYRVNMQFAKMSRGKMTRFIIQDKIDKAKDLQAFNADGYRFAKAQSSDTEFVYLRNQQ
jgi:cytoplasmic iron level regulating protein YaaA (DUF328/UPF0246 family)